MTMGPFAPKLDVKTQHPAGVVPHFLYYMVFKP